MKFEISEQVINNLLAFLDRIEYKGFKEIAAINEIMNVLNSTVKEENEK
jgi:hypothetical protein